MATAQLQKNVVSQSAVMFPNKVTTEQQSLILVKRLLAVSVSCITYLRGIFPEHAYGTRYIEDLCVKILREDKNSPGSTQLVKWMMGCYDALQKQYTVTECYQFKFKYTKAGPVMDITSKNRNISSMMGPDTKKASILLIRKLYILMQNLGPLPNNICLTMKLFYYDEVTPPDYQPPGFKQGDCEGMMFEGEPMYLSVGEVATPFHMLKVKVTTEKDRMAYMDKSILIESDEKLPVQTIDFDNEDLEEQNCSMKDDFVQENKTEEKEDKHRKEQELNLNCEGDEVMKPDEDSNLDSSTQLDQLVSKTSELEVSCRKTRSGRVIKTISTKRNQYKKAKKEHLIDSSASVKKRSCLDQENHIHSFEVPCSQDEVPTLKRRKFSEPEDPF
ncbi:HORMA domain-containing protein 1 isoform X2 [Protopterus annectens]|uniref:HORMA domain-containing protein 1 isoform X2 n=1 Tax=Protopterus annectens TaxID=7888 RepID=UPI001CFBB049|nr:HORMA domain-containing protein 1 isoform X2 [Protopterus annectens]